MHHVQERGIVFVYDNYNFAAGLGIRIDDETFQALVKLSLAGFAFAVYLFVVGKFAVQFLLQCLLVHVFGRAHVEMQHGVLRPLCF